MKRCFTLIEIVITVIIILIITTFGGITYQQLLENARAKVCAVNLKALDAAVEAYTLESDAFPASLGELKTEQLMKAYAKVIKKDDWWTKFSYLFVKLNTPREAYAQMLTPGNLKKYGLSPQILHCPDDLNGSPSYGINSNYKGKRWGKIPKDAIMVADCDSSTFKNANSLAYRHKGRSGLFAYKYAQAAVKKSKKVKKIKKNQVPVSGGAGGGTSGAGGGAGGAGAGGGTSGAGGGAGGAGGGAGGGGCGLLDIGCWYEQAKNWAENQAKNAKNWACDNFGIGCH